MNVNCWFHLVQKIFMHPPSITIGTRINYPPCIINYLPIVPMWNQMAIFCCDEIRDMNDLSLSLFVQHMFILMKPENYSIRSLWTHLYAMIHLPCNIGFIICMKARFIMEISLDPSFTRLQVMFSSGKVRPFKVDHPLLIILHCGQEDICAVLDNIILLMPIHIDSFSDHSSLPTKLD